MRIAIVADPYIPVPPINYGGIERIIYMLVDGLIKNGHDVVLVAHADSVVDCELIKYPTQSKLNLIKNMQIVAKVRYFKPDIIHSFARLAYLVPLLPKSYVKIMSYQREPTISQIKKALLISKKHTLAFTGCSDYISDQIKPFAKAYTIYNGYPDKVYTPNFKTDKSAPLLFLGRVEHEKGAHLAIEVAKHTGRKLIIAGNIPDKSKTYFDEQIKPNLSEQIQFAGEVNDQQKNKMLGESAALLMPILWNEPFGIVIVEAMACGTPVIALNTGAIPEIITHNRSGFVCSSLDEMIDGVNKLHAIKREDVYQDAQKFNQSSVVNSYQSLYEMFLNTN
jgi:glycosyltransferase involved in cell wall biosynthesis